MQALFALPVAEGHLRMLVICFEGGCLRVTSKYPSSDNRKDKSDGDEYITKYSSVLASSNTESAP